MATTLKIYKQRFTLNFTKRPMPHGFSLTGNPSGIKSLDGHLIFGPMRLSIFVLAFFASTEEFALTISGSGFTQELGNAGIFGGRKRS